jgi:predicted AlkP superfamily phosphohydrolase/phosphomutase
MAKRGVVIGLDGAAWHLLDPIIEQGAMPRLAALRRRGAAGLLRSTVPTYTPPAWTSAVTGVNPGRHGVYGFVTGHAQAEKQQLVHPGLIKAPTVWEMANAQGARAGIFNLPLCYPPSELEGWMVSGIMTPGFDVRVKGFASPPEIEKRILEEWEPRYEVDTIVHYERDWRDSSLCDRALAAISQRKKVLEELLALDPPRVVFAVLESPDRLQHVYYRYMDPADELYETPRAKELRPAITRCFQAMDEIVGLLEDHAGPDGGVVVCSDHGFTAWEMSVHVNTLLEQWGYLKLRPGARLMQSSLARILASLAKRFVPRKAARRAKGKTFAAIDWSKTRAFASPIPQQGVFINLEGRERFGIVEPSELAGLKDEIAERFLHLEGPDGGRVTDLVHRSEEVFHGDALEGAPDLLPVFRARRYEVNDELFHRNPFSDYRHLPRGEHDLDGVVIVAGPGVAAGKTIEGSIMDVAPTLLHAAGLAVPEGLDGDVLTGAYDPDWLQGHPVRTTVPPAAGSRPDESPYSEEEEALIEESLRGLGYL